MKISIIAAIGKNRELGKDNKLLWYIPEDFKRFKTLTSGHPIIMGRKTWESLLLKPLPNRTNIIITQNLNFKAQNYPLRSEANSSKLKTRDLLSVNSLEQAIDVAKKVSGAEEVFIIGGGQIYEQAIKKGLADKLYLTIVDGDFDADTFFPDYSQFKKVVFEKEGKSEKYKYKFLELER